MARDNAHNGEAIAVTDMHDFPCTVRGHEEHRTGTTLITIDPDPKRDLETFDNEPQLIRFAGTDPEAEE